MNGTPRAAEYISLFIDDKLRKGIKASGGRVATARRKEGVSRPRLPFEVCCPVPLLCFATRQRLAGFCSAIWLAVLSVVTAATVIAAAPVSNPGNHRLRRVRATIRWTGCWTG